ncbi:putative transaldolase [Anaplasma phagocytophilum]|uniref:fructose-6-phosphate aldolase n=1 Tax=Anaplasma phagocytophilum TaxID=948 RepID=UPI0007E0F737|nr:fructose-6-phosphate aldolase [Anaplasma phagocytophilum]SCV62102.1 putative transaldolase [Anaplasma phagocytophilum]SCV63482.1 putative transaldolase [Anaplasma phagocytophilum]SCV65549.1 putative transaldolase [Anaplasma phagocytophilum]
MKIFLDTIDIDSIAALYKTGAVDGITTNPALLSKSERPYRELLEEICSLVPGDISVEVVSVDADDMVAEGLKLAKIAKNVVVKLPLTFDGIRACNILTREHDIKVNVTLCFSATQALMAAKAGATYVSPFMGRIDDLGGDGAALIRDIRCVYSNYGFETQVLAASVRSPMHVLEAAKAGAEVATVPVSVFKQLFLHPLTDKGLADFLKSWEVSGRSIL